MATERVLVTKTSSWKICFKNRFGGVIVVKHENVKQKKQDV